MTNYCDKTGRYGMPDFAKAVCGDSTKSTSASPSAAPSSSTDSNTTQVAVGALLATLFIIIIIAIVITVLVIRKKKAERVTVLLFSLPFLFLILTNNMCIISST